LPKLLINKCILYADDTKIIGEIRNLIDLANIQSDIVTMSKWCQMWGMNLNTNKCKVMHIGSSNQNNNYFIDDGTGSNIQLCETACEKDLGVYISSDLSWTRHIQDITARANRILGMLKRTFTSRDPIIWKKLYTSLVRPNLEFAVQVWNPYLEKDINMIERVQRRATKIAKLDCRNYNERLKILELTTLKERRIRGDLIELYKLNKGFEVLHPNSMPKFGSSSVDFGPSRSLRGNSFKIRRDIFSSKNRNKFCKATTIRHNFFTNRAAPYWNALPNNVIQAANVNSFKAKLDNLSMVKTTSRYAATAQ